MNYKILIKRQTEFFSEGYFDNYIVKFNNKNQVINYMASHLGLLYKWDYLIKIIN